MNALASEMGHEVWDRDVSQSHNPRMPGKAAVGCLAFLVLFWSCATLAIDGVLGWGAVRQIQSASYSIAPGKVTQSKLECTMPSMA